MDELDFMIFTGKGLVTNRKSIWDLSADDRANPTMKAEIVALDKRINAKLTTPIESVFPLPSKDLLNSEDDELTEPIDKGLTSLELEDTTHAELDKYLMEQIFLPVGEERVPVTVLKQKLDLYDKNIGKQHSNPKLDTREYDVLLTHSSLLKLLLRISMHKLMQRVVHTLSSKTLSTIIVSIKLLPTIPL
jgi:hypothetical protein